MQQISYRGKSYRVQDANGWKHIIVTESGIKKRIGINSINTKVAEQKPDIVNQYIFGGLFVTHSCAALEYWIYRHRLGNRITALQYKQKFNIKKKLCSYKCT